MEMEMEIWRRSVEDPFVEHSRADDLILIDKHTPLANRIDLHTHACLEIGCCLSGKGTFYFSNKTYEVRPGDLFVVNHLEHHIAQADPGEPCEFLFLFFGASILAEHHRLLIPFHYRLNAFQNRIGAEERVSTVIRAIIEEMYEEYRERGEEAKAMLKGLLYQALVHLYRHFHSRSVSGEPENFLQLSLMLQPAIDYIEKNFRGPLVFEEVASLLALSPSRVRQLFKKVYGFGFHDFVNQLRINESKRLLLTTELTVLEVGLRSGFQSLASFYRSFNGVVGTSPNHYRRLGR